MFTYPDATGQDKKAFYGDAEKRPKIPAPNFEAIPAALRSERRWMLWNLEWATNKWTKLPKQAHGGNAKSNDPATWASFDAVREAYLRGGFDGIGFALGGGFVGVDLDNCRDPQTGAGEEWAREIINALGSYTEVSPSGTGFKVFCLGEWHGGWTRKTHASGEVEVYTRQYFTVTGVLA